MKVFLGLFITSLLGISVSASELTEERLARQTFRNQVKAAQKICPTLDCPQSPLRVLELTAYQRKQLPASTREQLRKAADELVQGWADTILEGEYHAYSNFRIDSIATLSEGDKVIGYRMTYSSKAYYTGDCGLNGTINMKSVTGSIKDCLEGRITESGFVPTSFKNPFPDDYDTVEFESKDGTNPFIDANDESSF